MKKTYIFHVLSLIPFGGAVKLTWDHYHLTKWEVTHHALITRWPVWIVIIFFIVIGILLIRFGAKMNRTK